VFELEQLIQAPSRDAMARTIALHAQRSHPFALIGALSACGGGGATQSPGNPNTGATGFPQDFVSPPSAYAPPTQADPNAFALQPAYVDPYWVAALINEDQAQTGGVTRVFETGVAFAFPDVVPDYYSGAELSGWAPASDAVRAAFRAVFSDLGAVLDIDFVEVTDLEAFNVIAISQNDQPGLAGYAFFPNMSLFIGSDILISNESASPATNGTTTNFDYELVLHELGHALGLKHPFEVDGSATTVLSSTEDTSFWTVMTYTLRPTAYDGAFRDLDLMALIDMFGVNPSFRAGGDTYSFLSASGVFVIDGGGLDTISAAGRTEDAYIDLRPGMHSHLGAKSSLITAPFQLTISAGSVIEIATGGSGDDYLVGNSSDNVLRSGAGRDRIFGGEGADIIQAGPGDDLIDLSEVVAKRDVVVFETSPAANGTDLIYAFAQGASGDALEFSPLAGAELLPVVTAADVPVATLGGVILRLAGAALDSASSLHAALSVGGLFSNLRVADGVEVLVLTAQSQATGLDQSLFHVQKTPSDLVVSQLATFVGNALDIDHWHAANFS
jgi:serralysin